MRPATDGGAYLIGMRRAAYDRAAFLRVDWQTPLVLEELKIYTDGDFCCLDEKSDVDSLADLARVLGSHALPVFLKIRLLIFINRFLPAVSLRTHIAPIAVFPDCCSLRGPPRYWSLSPA